ncbi:dihydroorotate dehydrogenase electron transfer subunit [candidate division NPL-UPA2 bacterium Unc8]|uniref:Dihydroorotate dehydrogenase B (NAD(+)), electron transfer subunit n=1 Tax=candidate division NPL-UPA2 bacterium Unc8 TaxID=1980939 RepID=A0A399FYA6_UNCN2|nr:Dihydroorotate dehydrogenase B (NAD(+)), electron transfer subunit [Bacillota bacterium]MBT9137859.1 Dihydroorotate dehydrogenase B (NAD(+)), electron transfer subunit [Bacillota bacterium]MBT9146472.1 Dihydroorotate dehydrogenase B (NAD(+)), electron transfer subunit [Bacillota bacterium]RII00212.1 MAG: dihydroorotate dehydrogenase electron transfer subunit [candidate division NPL-UPA2 bacterium Unc8]
MWQDKVSIVTNKEISPEYFKMSLEAGKIAKIAKPGQFLHIKIDDMPFLRRPFSLHRMYNSNIDIFYHVVGKGTQALSQKESGAKLDILGPLGNGFEIKEIKNQVLIGGGIGIAPLFALAEALVNTSTQICVIIGAKTKERLLCEEDFAKLGCKVQVATEDGTGGKKGMATDILKDILLSLPPTETILYSSGPNKMLAEVSRVANVASVSCQISLEETICCGVGACLGCVVKTATGYKRVCSEGPVFKSDEILLGS